MSGVWLPAEEVGKIDDEAEKYLAGQFKLAYINGKGKKFVPVLVPVDIVQAIELLTDARLDHGVCKTNGFLFPTRPGKSHCSGWHAVQVVCKEAGIYLNATMQRHYVSTIYASLDMAPHDRKVYLAHMGHEEDTCTFVYP